MAGELKRAANPGQAYWQAADAKTKSDIAKARGTTVAPSTGYNSLGFSTPGIKQTPVSPAVKQPANPTFGKTLGVPQPTLSATDNTANPNVTSPTDAQSANNVEANQSESFTPVKSQTITPAPFNQTPNEPQEPQMANEVSGEPGAGQETYIEPTKIEVPEDEKDFWESLGDKAEKVKKRIDEYEKRTGKKVYTPSTEFQREMQTMLGYDKSWDTTFARFSWKTGAAANAEALQGTTAVKNDFTEVQPNVPYSTQIATILNDEGSQTLQSQLQTLFNLSPDTPGEDLIKANLMLKLGAIDDPYVAQYLDRMTQRAKDTYIEGISLAEKSMAELDAVIDGTLTEDPETSAGLMGKIYKSGEERQLEYIDSEKAYVTARNEIMIEDLRSKRADLEGYTKAKLYSMGAQDSSAGIALLSKVVSEADMNIRLAELDNTHAVTQLNIQAKGIIANFTDNVAQLVQGLRDQESQTTATYRETIDKIEGDRFANMKDKREKKLSAFSEYMSELSSYQAEQKKAEAEAIKQAYEQTKDLRDWAYKVSGLTGTVYVPGENGELMSTGIPTFDAAKWQDESDQALMRIQVSQSSERRQWAKSLIDTYGSAASPYVEQLMGLPSGSLAGYETAEELNRAFDMVKEQNDLYQWAVDNGYKEHNGEVLTDYERNGGGVHYAGIGIDPMSLPDVRENILQSGTVTQGFKKAGSGGTYKNGAHDGIDYVSKDGYVHALRGGQVVDLIPWDGKNPWGNRVIMQDDTGALWQYAHMGNRNVKGDNPFTVNIGDRIDAGGVLGAQGNTGHVVSKKSPNDPSYGVHIHANIIGKSNLQTPQVVSKQKEEEPKTDIQKAGHALGQLAGGYLSGNLPKPTQKQLETMYFKEFGKAPSKADIDLLKQHGYEALKIMIEKRSPKKTTTSKTTDLFTQAIPEDY